MRIFLKELEKRHRANLWGLYKRHKNAVGFLILAIGTAIALMMGANAQTHADERAERQNAIICRNTVNTDLQSLTNIASPTVLATFHLTPEQAVPLVRIQLVQNAKERAELRPSKPMTACSPTITKLPVIPKGVSHEVRQAIEQASAPL